MLIQESTITACQELLLAVNSYLRCWLIVYLTFMGGTCHDIYNKGELAQRCPPLERLIRGNTEIFNLCCKLDQVYQKRKRIKKEQNPYTYTPTRATICVCISRAVSIKIQQTSSVGGARENSKLSSSSSCRFRHQTRVIASQCPPYPPCRERVCNANDGRRRWRLTVMSL